MKNIEYQGIVDVVCDYLEENNRGWKLRGHSVTIYDSEFRETRLGMVSLSPGLDALCVSSSFPGADEVMRELAELCDGFEIPVRYASAARRVHPVVARDFR